MRFHGAKFLFILLLSTGTQACFASASVNVGIKGGVSGRCVVAGVLRPNSSCVGGILGGVPTIIVNDIQDDRVSWIDIWDQCNRLQAQLPRGQNVAIYASDIKCLWNSHQESYVLLVKVYAPGDTVPRRVMSRTFNEQWGRQDPWIIRGVY